MIFKNPQLYIILTILTKQKRTDVVEIATRRSITLRGSYNTIAGRPSMYILLLQSFEVKTDHDDDRSPKLRSDVGMCARRAKTSRSSYIII